MRYGARGDGTTDDTAAIQRCIDDAEAYAAAHSAGATVFFPSGSYRVSSTLTVQEDGLVLQGGGGTSRDFSGYGSAIVPSEDFANDTYVLSFEAGAHTRTLQGCQLLNLSVMKYSGDTLANTVHGLFWQVARGYVRNVVIEKMTGRGVGLSGYDSSWSTVYSTFCECHIRENGGDGIAGVGTNVADMFFTNVVIGANVGIGIHNGGSGNIFTGCHVTSNENNVKFDNAGMTEIKFANCVFELPDSHNVDIDALNGSFYRITFVGCHFDTELTLDADNTYDNIYVHRSSGSGVAEVLITGCTFAATQTPTNEPRYHINFAGAAAERCIANGNRFRGPVGTANVNHNSGAVLCLVNNLGINVGDPASTGQWNTATVDPGVMVVNTSTNAISIYANGAWRALN